MRATLERTLRRDVDRLRELGYPVEAQRGVDGGYQLAPGASLPQLVLDDDEAVALAVGLMAAAQSSVAGTAESSMRALAKVVQVDVEDAGDGTCLMRMRTNSFDWPAMVLGNLGAEFSVLGPLHLGGLGVRTADTGDDRRSAVQRLLISAGSVAPGCLNPAGGLRPYTQSDVLRPSTIFRAYTQSDLRTVPLQRIACIP